MASGRKNGSAINWRQITGTMIAALGVTAILGLFSINSKTTALEVRMGAVEKSVDNVATDVREIRRATSERR